MKPKDVLGLAKDRGAVMVDLKFMDFIGLWQHFTIPLAELEEEIFEEGLGFDGSSIRGWRRSTTSDMLVMPDPTTAVMDPFMTASDTGLICNISDPITKEPTPATRATSPCKAEKYLRSTGHRRHRVLRPRGGVLRLRRGALRQQAERTPSTRSTPARARGTPAEGARANRGYKLRYKEGYFPVAPMDTPAGHPHRDVPDDGGRGHRGGAPAPRGGHRAARRRSTSASTPW